MRRSQRLVVDTPYVGDKVELFYNSSGYKGLYKGEIMKKKHQTYEIYFPFSKTKTQTTLFASRYRPTPREDGEWTSYILILPCGVGGISGISGDFGDYGIWGIKDFGG